MKKSERQRRIKQLINEHAIRKQEEFVELLHAQGVEVTQATISRDIQEMQLIKVSDEQGSFRYSISSKKNELTSQKMHKMVKEAVLSAEVMGQHVALKTVPGSAAALGLLVEKVYADELFTMIATDDKVLMIFKLAEDAMDVQQTIDSLVYG